MSENLWEMRYVTLAKSTKHWCELNYSIGIFQKRALSRLIDWQVSSCKTWCGLTVRAEWPVVVSIESRLGRNHSGD